MSKANVLSGSSVTGDDVVNGAGENLGSIYDLMLDVESGIIAYAVLSFGGFLGMGDKLFAVPWGALRLDQAKKRFVLNVPKETLEKAPGFNKDDWPDFADRDLGASLYSYYGTKAYW